MKRDKRPNEWTAPVRRQVRVLARASNEVREHEKDLGELSTGLEARLSSALGGPIGVLKR